MAAVEGCGTPLRLLTLGDNISLSNYLGPLKFCHKLHCMISNKSYKRQKSGLLVIYRNKQGDLCYVVLTVIIDHYPK